MQHTPGFEGMQRSSEVRQSGSATAWLASKIHLCVSRELGGTRVVVVASVVVATVRARALPACSCDSVASIKTPLAVNALHVKDAWVRIFNGQWVVWAS